MTEVSWRLPTAQDCGNDLVGNRIRIWWDGDRTFYSGSVVSYDVPTAKHQVLYDGDDTDLYIEDLESGAQQWEVAKPLPERRGLPARAAKPESFNPAHFAGAAGRKCTYVDMALEAVHFLNDKNGVSLSSIRKWILTKYPETKDKQKASFNSLTIKALMKLVSEGTLEKVKHSFRLSQRYMVDEQGRAREGDEHHRRSLAILRHQAKEASANGRRMSPGRGRGRRPVVRIGRPGGETWEANMKMRREIESRLQKRNAFLSARRALLLPFMQDGDNFFTKLDRKIVMARLEKEQREAAEKAKRELEERERAARRLAQQRDGTGSGGYPGAGARFGPGDAAMAAAKSREATLSDDIEFRAIPADPMSVAETLVKFGVLQAKDIAPGAAKVALTGQRCTEWPPLQVDPMTGVPTMEDRDMLGRRIDQQGPFLNYYVTWPGTRLPMDDIREVSQMPVDLNYNHIYYLEKREYVPPSPPAAPTLGPHGWVYPPQQPPPVARIVGRTTALRLRSGEFVHHRIGFMRRTQAYAKRNNVPVDNLVTFSIINPHTSRRYNVTREFCAAPCYASIYKRLLRDTLRKNPSLIPILSSQAPGARAAAAAAEAAEAEARMRAKAEQEAAALRSAGMREGATYVGVSADSLSRINEMRRPVAEVNRCVPSCAPPHPPPPRLPPDASGVLASTAGRLPPPRSHPLPRGPGGIDILSGPTTPTQEPERSAEHWNRPPSTMASHVGADRIGPSMHHRAGGYSAVMHTPSAVERAREEGANAAVAAAAAMLGLGGGAGGTGGTGGTGGGPSLPSGSVAPRSAASNGHRGISDGAGRHVGGMQHSGLRQGSLPPPLSPRSKAQVQMAAEMWNSRARVPPPSSVIEAGAAAEAAHWQVLQRDAGELPVDATLYRTIEKRLDHAQFRMVRGTNGTAGMERQHDHKFRTSAGCRPASNDVGFSNGNSRVEGGGGEVEEGIRVDRVKAEEKGDEDRDKDGDGDETEQERARRISERAARKALTIFDPSDVLKGVPEVEVPGSIKANLHDHQKDGLRWMVYMYQNGMPIILGDQMGMGKTLQSITFVAYLRDHLRVNGPYLVVVPLSVLSNWISEIERFCPSLRAVRFHGPREERSRIKEEEIKDLAEFDVVVTTYEMLSAEANFFKRRFLWQLVIVDEGHRLKNDKSQLSQKLKQVNTICRVLLTGTPLQNNLRELWALLHFLMPDVFSTATAERFEQGFDLARGTFNPRRMEQANELLALFMLRRVKSQVKIDLPPKQEIQILVKLSPAQHMVYRHLLVNQEKRTLEAIMAEAGKYAREEAKGAGGDSRSTSPTPSASGSSSGKGGNGVADGAKTKKMNDTDYRKLMNLLLQLRKVCNHPYLLLDVEPSPMETEKETVDKMVAASGKLSLLDRMLPRLQAHGHRCLIFSQFTSMLDVLEEYCAGRGYEHARLDGETNRVQRRLDIRRFNAPDSKVFVFLISTRAGGLGINLATADTVILYDSDWNPQVDLQAMERAHRIGQTKPVSIYRLVCRGSVEERMVSRAAKKLFLNAMVAERRNRAKVKKEGAEEDSDGDVGREENGEEEWQQALTVGGLSNSISKGELAALIQQGASAILQTEEEGDMTDLELEKLVTSSIPNGSSASEAPANGGEDGEASFAEDCVPRDGSMYTGRGSGRDRGDGCSSSVSASASESSRQRGMATVGGVRVGDDGATSRRSLQEVDLRQLDGVVYEKAEEKGPGGLLGSMLAELDRMNLGKRVTKNRVVMVDSKGTGLRGKLAVLAETMESDTPKVEEEPIAKRQRSWQNMNMCMLCRKRAEKGRPLTPCGYCPRSFHADCLEKCGSQYVNAVTFVCPQHRCMGCTRTTAAAGGLLFRCQTCINSFCEDCLPEDEVESLGRNRQLEALGYYGKQSYWIRCQTCVESGRTLEDLGEDDGGSSREGDDGSEVEEDDEEEEEDGISEALGTDDGGGNDDDDDDDDDGDDDDDDDDDGGDDDDRDEGEVEGVAQRARRSGGRARDSRARARARSRRKRRHGCADEDVEKSGGEEEDGDGADSHENNDDEHDDEHDDDDDDDDDEDDKDYREGGDGGKEARARARARARAGSRRGNLRHKRRKRYREREEDDFEDMDGAGESGEEQEDGPARDRGRSRSRSREGDGDREDEEEEEGEDEEEEEEEEDPEPEPEPEPKTVTFAEALRMLQDHPAAEAAFMQPRCKGPPGSPTVGKRPRGLAACNPELIAAKVHAERYRSTGAFESDLRQMLTQGKGPRSLSSEQKEIVGFFERDILPCLRK